MRPLPFRLAALALVPLLAAPRLFAWGSHGHQMINQLAVEKLPPDVPAFLRAPAAEAQIVYLGPEPDRWRSPQEPELNAAQAPEHFINFETADLASAAIGGKLPRKRFDYIAALYAAGLIHPDLARDLRPERAGLLPYEATEVFDRLQAALRAYRELKAKHEDTAPAEQAAIFYAGWLGHYVGDGSQPLHVSANYNGWVAKDNPHNYANDHTIHWRFEGTFVDANLKLADVEPLVASVHVLADPFEDFLAYLRVSQTYTERVYQLDQQHAFTGAGTPEGRQFAAERLAAGAAMLRDSIDTAWVNSAKAAPGNAE